MKTRLNLSNKTLFPFALALLAGCATQSPLEKKVEAEVAQEAPMEAGSQVANASRNVIFEAESLNPQQKDRLKALQAKSAQEAATLRQEIGRTQMVLMKSLVDPQKKDAEIDVLKYKIVDLERKRTRHFLSTLDSAREILGRSNSTDERIYRAFLSEPTQFDLTN